MARLSDGLLNHEITADCPGCGAENHIKLRQFRTGGSIRCRGCREAIQLKTDGRGLDDVRRALDDLDRSLDRLKR